MVKKARKFHTISIANRHNMPHTIFMINAQNQGKDNKIMIFSIYQTYTDYRAMGLSHKNAIKNTREDIRIWLSGRRKCEALLALKHLKNPSTV